MSIEPLSTDSILHSPLWQLESVKPLLHQLTSIRADMVDLESKKNSEIQRLAPHWRLSARNLLHYVALRRHDIRSLQEELVPRGLSSLGRCESYVMANLETVLGILHEASAAEIERLSPDKIPVDFSLGKDLLARNAESLLGENSHGSGPPIMVTMSSEAADDYLLVRDLLANGMSVMRINCAHDNRDAWGRMIKNLRRAEKETGHQCRIAMDLAGPKIRTGPIEPGPKVISWRPYRDSFGRVISPARIWISPTAMEEPPPLNADAKIPVPEDWLNQVAVGDIFQFADAAGRDRRLTIVQQSDQGLWAESTQTTYVTPETIVKKRPVDGAAGDSHRKRLFSEIPPCENFLVLRKGELLLVTDADTLGRPMRIDDQARLINPASIGCTLPGIFKFIHRGDRILFDDGKIAGIVNECSENHLLVEIIRARKFGQRLRADKGINFPDTDLQLPALTNKDLEDLEFIVQHADMVSYSFVRRPDDIRQLRDHLQRMNRTDLGIILKIENRQAFDNLPLLLLEIMYGSGAGVMIARGDLAVECGWERLAEIQEEILWMCEAAHMPVIWATQVLERLAKKGLPTRAEVTDAAMGARAECVMLNKGPNIVETVGTLNEILRRMQTHQVKKRATFRRLRMADRLFGDCE